MISNEEGRDAFKILTDEPTRRRALERSRRRWEGNIRMGLKEGGLIRLRIEIIGKSFGMWHWRSGINKAWISLVNL